MTDVDPFDLPDWLGVAEVTWVAEDGVRAGHRVPGRLTGEGHDDQVCDLLAVDEAFPAPVADEQVRLHAHQAWRHGQIHLLECRGRLTLAVPGTRFDADLVLDALDRLARAVGALPERYTARLRVGANTRRGRGADR